MIIQWLWSLLPDRCEMPDCGRHGVRGNENVFEIDGKRTRVCDYCHAKMMTRWPVAERATRITVDKTNDRPVS